MLFSCLFCLLGREGLQCRYFILINGIPHLFGCMSLGFIARGYGLAAPSARLSRATLLAILLDLIL
jgi:hypothetical protein